MCMQALAHSFPAPIIFDFFMKGQIAIHQSHHTNLLDGDYLVLKDY